MKKLVVFLTAASMCLAPASAFAADITPEELMQKNNEVSEENTSTSMTMPMDFDLGLKMSIPIDAGDGTTTNMDFEMPIKLNGNCDVAMIREPLQMSIKGDFKVESISMMDQVVMPESNMTMEMYMIASEDGTKVDTYTMVDDGESTPEWIHQVTDISEVASMFDVQDLAELDSKTFEELLPDVDFHYELAETDTGYDLGMKIAYADLMPIIQKAIEAESDQLPEGYEEIMDTISGVLGGLTMNYVMGINKDTYQLETIHMDMNDSDLSGLNQVISSILASSGQNVAVELTANNFSVDATCSYNDVSEITVPADALATEAVDISSMLEEQG